MNCDIHGHTEGDTCDVCEGIGLWEHEQSQPEHIAAAMQDELIVIETEVSGWQPIESAPKKPFSSVIIYAPSESSDEGTVGEAFLANDGNWYWAGTQPGYHDPISECNSPPTHWQRMPAPPRTLRQAV